MPTAPDILAPSGHQYRRAADVPPNLRSQSRWRALGRRVLPGTHAVAYVACWPGATALYPFEDTEPLPPRPECKLRRQRS